MDDDLLILAVAVSFVVQTVKQKKRAPNRPRNRVIKNEILLQDYFWDADKENKHVEIRSCEERERFVFGPQVSEAEFQRRNRMPRKIFWRIFQVCEQDLFFQQKHDASKLLGHSANQKFIAALRQLCYGTAADAQADYTVLAETTALHALERFCDAVLRTFGNEYLRLPTLIEMREIEKQFSAQGFPGAVGAVDCSSWQWKSCPVAWHGEYRGRHDHPQVRMEAWADANLYVWSLYYGCSGTHNDLNILNASPLFNGIMNGNVDMRVRFNTCFEGSYQPKFHYFLVDGIYPNWAIFAKTIPESKRESELQRMYSLRQEAVRKTIERLFGVLFSRFHILTYPTRSLRRTMLSKIVRTCVVIHNMIIKERASTEDSESASEWIPPPGNVELMDGSSIARVRNETELTVEEKSTAAWVASRHIRSKMLFDELQNALINNIKE